MIDVFNIEIAKVGDHLLLSEITKLSKAHWGYDAAQLKMWDADLTISASYIEENIVYKLLQNKTTIGYYSCSINDQVALLDNLFIHPDFLRKGLGSLLLEHLYATLQMENINLIRLEADPHAVDFYLKKGFSVIGKTPTSIEHRFLPVMEKKLEKQL